MLAMYLHVMISLDTSRCMHLNFVESGSGVISEEYLVVDVSGTGRHQQRQHVKETLKRQEHYDGQGA